MSAHFLLADRTIADIRTQTANGDKYLPEFSVDIIDSNGELVARGIKTLYIRRKQRSNNIVTSSRNERIALCESIICPAWSC